MDPNMAQQPPYAEMMAPPPQQPVQQTTPQEENNSPRLSSTTSSSTINHGKRHAAPLVVTPRKHINHPFSSTGPHNAASNVLSYSSRATPPPAKVFHGHSPLTPPPTPEVQHQLGAPNPSSANA